MKNKKPAAPQSSVINDPFGKILNPHLAEAALSGTGRHGDFKAWVRLDAGAPCPEGYRPLAAYGSGLYAASIPCDRIEQIVADADVLSVELREYVTQ